MAAGDIGGRPPWGQTTILFQNLENKCGTSPIVVSLLFQRVGLNHLRHETKITVIGLHLCEGITIGVLLR